MIQKKWALFTFTGRIAAERERPDGTTGDEGIARAIAEEPVAPDGHLVAGRKLTAKVNEAKKCCFTLFELLVVLFLLSLGAALTGLKIKELYRDQRFSSESQQVLNHLALAQEIMLILDTDVTVHLVQEARKGPLLLSLRVEKPLERKWAAFVERQIPLTAIQSCEFGEQRSSELTLHFSLGRMDQGLLCLHGAEGSDQRFYIALPGHPRSLNGGTAMPDKKPPQRGGDQNLYPLEVSQQLYGKNR